MYFLESPFSKTFLDEVLWTAHFKTRVQFSQLNNYRFDSIFVLIFSADLIMLGLATHEPNFTIIREEFKPNKPRPCALCGQMGHEIKDCQGLAREKQGEVIDSSSHPSTQSFTSTLCMNFYFVFSLSAWWICRHSSCIRTGVHIHPTDSVKRGLFHFKEMIHSGENLLRLRHPRCIQVCFSRFGEI